ncbi:MAG: diguanylate cyclase domain-containing protein [Candidatus Acidiferrales bacterium]
MRELDDPEIFRNVLESMQTGAYLMDRDLKIVFWNEKAGQIAGYRSQDVVGRLHRADLISQSRPGYCALSDATESIAGVLRDGRVSVLGVMLRHKEGYRIPVRLRGAAVRNARGAIVGAVETFEESAAVADWHRRQNKLTVYGAIDEGTGVLTPTVIHSHLRELLGTFSECRVPFSILCIQVDDVEQLRAKYGPALLPSVRLVLAQTIENSLRPTDFLGRHSENQFLAILLECTSRDVKRAADRLRRIVDSSEIEWWGDMLTVSASFGGTAVRPGDTLEIILSRAEFLLQQCMSTGAGRILVSED